MKQLHEYAIYISWNDLRGGFVILRQMKLAQDNVVRNNSANHLDPKQVVVS